MAVPVGASPDPRQITAEVTELSFRSPIRVARNNATIYPPHWSAGQNVDDNWNLAQQLRISTSGLSKRAAVYLVRGAGSSWDVEVKVRVQSQNVSGSGKLVGTLGGLRIEGTCPTGSGDHTVQARIVDPPERIASFRGSIGWSMEVSGMASVPMNSTPVEVYFILRQPIPAFNAAGVWVEALRVLCTRAGLAGLGPNDEREVAARVTRYCHSDHGLRYDTWGGRPFYVNGHLGGTFRLGGYLQKSSPIANCYDQAAAIQTFCGSVGVVLTWLYLAPYGYILPANLLGVGMCNSPFFGADVSRMMVPPNDPGRTSFGNHAFCEFGGGGGGGGPSVGGSALIGGAIGVAAGAAAGAAVGAAAGAASGGNAGESAAAGAAIGAAAGAAIGAATGAGVAAASGGGGPGLLDACAGPHVARESREQYVTASIDTTTTLNARHPPPWPGTAAMIVTGPGVQAVG